MIKRARREAREQKLSWDLRMTGAQLDYRIKKDQGSGGSLDRTMLERDETLEASETKPSPRTEEGDREKNGVATPEAAGENFGQKCPQVGCFMVLQ